jgi:hypothetical protein
LLLLLLLLLFLQGEMNATVVSESIPFLEYEIHRQIMYKLKVMGMNACFSLKFQLCINQEQMVAIATGTAAFLPALPAPKVLHITRNMDVLDMHDKQSFSIQQRIMELSKSNVCSLRHDGHVRACVSYGCHAELMVSLFLVVCDD